MAPERTCVGCRRTTGQDELVRVVREPDGGLRLGRELPGRGAWMCRGSEACMELAVTRRGFERAFRSKISVEEVAALRSEFSEQSAGC